MEAARQNTRFRVIYVLSDDEKTTTTGSGSDAAGAGKANGDGTSQARKPEGTTTINSLRERNIPVATIPAHAVAYSLSLVDMVVVGAEGVVENGGVISRLGTYQIALLAKAQGKPVYVLAESHKFVRLFPLGQYDLPIRQAVVRFEVEDGKVVETERGTVRNDRDLDEGMGLEKDGTTGGPIGAAIDYTVCYATAYMVVMKVLTILLSPLI